MYANAQLCIHSPIVQLTLRKRSDNNKDSPDDGTYGMQKYV